MLPARLRLHAEYGHLLPAVGLEHEADVVAETLVELWEGVVHVMRDPFFTDQQHAELCRRLPFFIVEMTMYFLAAFHRRRTEYSARQVFTQKGLSMQSASTTTEESQSVAQFDCHSSIYCYEHCANFFTHPCNVQ